MQEIEGTKEEEERERKKENERKKGGKERTWTRRKEGRE